MLANYRIPPARSTRRWRWEPIFLDRCIVYVTDRPRETSLDEEQNLIARAQRGDLQAYESLVKQYEDVAFHVAYLITHDDGEAADAAQDGFLRAYHALRTFRLGMPFRPWLLRIVTNLALNRVQSAQRRAHMAERYAQQAMLDDSHLSIHGQVVRREQHQRLRQAVDRLKPEQRTLIALRYFLELSESEVAETLKIPIGTVKSRLHRTLAQLREIIQRDFPDLTELTNNG
jgi:RNA polymerase sigma factor (sigma-70 family)